MSRILNAAGVPVEAEPTAETRGTAIELASNFSLVTGRGTVKMRIPGTDKAYVMLPQDARILGMKLIVQATKAIDTAIAMRCLLEVCQVALPDAVQMLKVIGAGTEADHAMVFEASLKMAEQDKVMEGDDEKSGPH